MTTRSARCRRSSAPPSSAYWPLSVVVFVLIALVIGLVRLLDNEVFDQRVWASYLLIGGIFVVAGTLISTMRHSRS